MLPLLALVPFALADTRPVAVAPFDAVAAHTGLVVTLTPAAEHSVVLEGRAEDVATVEVRQEGGRIVLSQNGSGVNRTVTARIGLPDLRVVQASSGAQVSTTAAFQPKALDVQADAGASVRLDATAGPVQVQATSGSSVTLTGTCAQLSVSAVAGARVDAGALRCETVQASAVAGGFADVRSSGPVQASETAGGRVRVRGGE